MNTQQTTPMPPSKLRFMGESDEAFLELGDQLVDTIERHAELGPSTRILDVGCGYGRLAHALQRRGFEGTYLGLDVQSRVIRWCTRSLGSERFEFRHADLQNERYNPAGKAVIPELEFDRGSFDVVCAFSVFTHMWHEDVEAYFELFRRVLADDGRAIATFFFMDRTWRQLADEGKAMRLPHARGRYCRFKSADEPLHVVGYELEWVVRRGIIAGLLPAAPPQFGSWSQRPLDDETDASFQDTIVFKRA